MFNDLISRSTLGDLAGTSAFQLGEEYLATGAVSHLRAVNDRITAQVEGTKTYRVELQNDEGELAYDCTCPRAADGYFCKHCVATGLAWLAENPAVPTSRAASGKRKRHDPWSDIKEYLIALRPDALVDILLEVAQRDDRLYQSLLVKADRSAGGGNLSETLRQAIDRATQIDDFVDWREVGTFAGKFDQVTDSLAELLKPATAAMLVDLAEYAIEHAENALEQIDDSSGEMGEIISRLGELHLNACIMAQPDPEELAERLFRFEMTLPFGVCSFDAVTYRDALGKDGLRRYRELAQAEWSKVKPRDAKAGYDARRISITRIMERLAEASGDVDELVAIKAMDLSSAFYYLGIANIWAKAGQQDKALDWAERGMKAFPERPDNRLRDFLVAAYLERKRDDEALQLTWIQFEERGTLENYKKLNDVAAKLGLWPAQRERALARVADAIAQEASATTRWKPSPPAPNYSVRVEIALWETDLGAALAFANQGICDRSLLIALAAKLESVRPGDALSLYRRVVPPIVEQTNNAAYDEAIKLIRKMGTLMQSQSQPRQFGDYLAELRMQYKQKRNFIKLLDEVTRIAAK